MNKGLTTQMHDIFRAPRTSLLCVGITLCFVSLARAKPVTQGLIEKAYKRAAFGAELKYIDGLLSNRAGQYAVFNSKGGRLDLSIERERFSTLFAHASRVRLSTKIEDYRIVDDSADVKITQVLEVELVNTKSDKLYTLVLTTKGRDRWKLIDGTPKMTASEVATQYFKNGPPLEDDKFWSMKRTPLPSGKKGKK